MPPNIINTCAATKKGWEALIQKVDCDIRIQKKNRKTFFSKYDLKKDSPLIQVLPPSPYIFNFANVQKNWACPDQHWPCPDKQSKLNKFN